MIEQRSKKACANVIVKSYFEDASYQYRADWLGQQSLDIFIPSLDLAFEYQGVQHSKPVERFGGEEHFQETVERDRRKKALCDENNIKLAYWNFDEPIEDNILSLKLGEFRIALPSKKSFPELGTDVFTKPKPKNSGEDKPFVYQYDKDFNLVGKFQTIETAAKAVGISKTSIAKVLREERKTAGKHFWYKGPHPLEEIPDRWCAIRDNQQSFSCSSKRIRQLDLNGAVIAEYPSIGQAARALGLRDDCIRDVLNGKQKTSHGYKWELA